MKKFKDLQELNNSGYLTMAQTNRLLKLLKSSLRARIGVDESHTRGFFNSPPDLVFFDRPMLYMPENKDKRVYAKSEKIAIEDLDISGKMYVFKESLVTELGKKYQLEDAPESTKFTIG